MSAVGDVIHTIPVLNKLRRRYPAAQLDWLVTPAIGELLRHHPAISNVDRIRPRRLVGAVAPTPFRRWPPSCARTRYDLVVDMHGQFRTAVFALATGAPVRIGFDRPRASVWDASPRKFPEETRKHAWQGAREGSWLAYTHHIPVPTLDLHAVDRYLNVGPLLGLDERPADFSFPIPASGKQPHRGAARHYYGAGGKRLAVLAPGTIWETKQWRSDRLCRSGAVFPAKRLCRRADRRARASAPFATRSRSLIPVSVNLAGETTLSELAALVRRAAICVTNDSGPMHLAVALDRPVVSIFGPTDPIWIGPYGRADAVLQANRPVLAVLSAATQPLPPRPCLHGERLRVRGDRAHRACARQQRRRYLFGPAQSA